jgi:hypothetical protein
MSFLLAALPFIGAGASLLRGVSALTTGQGQAAAATQEGRQAMRVATEEAGRSRYQSRFQLGAIRAQAGAQGTTFEGSPMASYLESAKQAELQAQDILYGGQLKKQQAGFQAQLYRRQGIFGLLGGVAGAAGSLGSTLIPKGGAPTPAPAPNKFAMWQGPLLTAVG